MQSISLQWGFYRDIKFEMTFFGMDKMVSQGIPCLFEEKGDGF